MKKLIIYGASYSDVIKLIDAINRSKPAWTILGFLDDTSELKGQVIHGYPVLGGRALLPELIKNKQTFFFNNVNRTRAGCQQVANLLTSFQCKIANLIHPSVDCNYVKMGYGCIIPEGCVIGANVVMGNFVTLRYGCVVSHDVTIEDFVLLGPGATIGGRAILQKACLVGAGATILMETKVGAASTVGAGAVATHDVAANKTVAGVPAKEVQGAPR